MAGKTFIKYNNDDKLIDGLHVMANIRTTEPTNVLSWLREEGFVHSEFTGVTFSGQRSTRHKEWGGDAAVAKTAAIKNIQKALTARILKRLDDGQPLVEVARKMKAIEGMQPQINDMERRLGIMQSVEPVLENAIKTLQKVVDVRGIGKK